MNITASFGETCMLISLYNSPYDDDDDDDDDDYDDDDDDDGDDGY